MLCLECGFNNPDVVETGSILCEHALRTLEWYRKVESKDCTTMHHSAMGNFRVFLIMKLDPPSFRYNTSVLHPNCRCEWVPWNVVGAPMHHVGAVGKDDVWEVTMSAKRKKVKQDVNIAAMRFWGCAWMVIGFIGIVICTCRMILENH